MIAPLLALAAVAPAPAPTPPPAPADVIIITAPPTGLRVMSPPLRIDRAALDRQASVTIADALGPLAGVGWRSNSRGEGVIQIRGSEERQTALFLDGAPLAVPWDGRFDLGLLPAGMIERIDVVRGAAPIEYGANAVGGVVDLVSRRGDTHRRARGEVMAGSGGLLTLAAAVSTPLGQGVMLDAAGQFSRQQHDRIADRAAIPFDPSPDRWRGNSDSRSRTGFAALRWTGHDRAQLDLSLLHLDAARGIPVEGHLDPARAAPRYWRVPQWRLTRLALGGQVALSGPLTLRATAWRTRFDQTIHAYPTASYDRIAAQEIGQDRVLGLRSTLQWTAAHQALRLSAMVQSLTHDQRDIGRGADPAGPLLRYRQRLASVGGEWDRALSPGLSLTLGAGIDQATYPSSGDKPRLAAATAPTFTAGLRQIAGPWTLTATLGRRTRFATPREAFGEALGRFLVNPALRPERVWLADGTVHWRSSDRRWTLAIAPWLASSDGLISQRVVRRDGARLRQRYNRRGAIGYGLDLDARWQIAPRLEGEWALSLQRGHSRREGDGTRPPLLQRPRHETSLALDWQPSRTLDLRIQWLHIGRALDFDADGRPAPLPPAHRINLVADWRLPAAPRWSLFAAADNVTNALHLPQLGLPAPGRRWRAGIRLRAE